MAKYCKYCGKQIGDDAQFCRFCGMRFDASSAQEDPIRQDTSKEDIPEKVPVTVAPERKSTVYAPASYKKPEHREHNYTSPGVLEETVPPTTSSNKKVLIIAAAVVLLAAIIGGVVIFLNLHKNKVPAVIPESATEFNGRHYEVYNESMSWNAAKDICEAKGGHLATITSADEQAFIESLLEESGLKKYHYWLGGTDREQEGAWKWLTEEDFADYTNWEQGKNTQPNNNESNDPEHGEDYMEIQTTKPVDNSGEYMKWNDICESGNSKSNQGSPWFYSQEHFGYICEWEE